MAQTFGGSTYYKPKKPSLGGDDINDLKIKNDLSNLPSVKGGNDIEGVQTITMTANQGSLVNLKPKISDTEYGLYSAEGVETQMKSEDPGTKLGTVNSGHSLNNPRSKSVNKTNGSLIIEKKGMNIQNIVGDSKEPNTAMLNPNDTSIHERNSLGLLEKGQTHTSAGDPTPKNPN